MKKQTPVNPKVQRQIEILQKYYDIDIENRIINFVLYYEKASDILINDVVTLGDIPRFNSDVLRRVSEILDTFPTEFKVNLSLQIDDYEGYEPKALLGSLNDSLEMLNYSIYRDKGKRWLTSAILVFVSMVILSFRIFAGTYGVLDTEGMFYEMFDIVAWVFLWQAVTIIFLTPQEIRSISFKIINRLLSVYFLDKKGEKLIGIEGEEMDKEWLRETKKEKAGRVLLLIGGTALVTIAVTAFISFITGIGAMISAFSVGEDGFSFLVIAGIDLFTVVIYAIGGIGAINIHRGRGPFRKAVKVFAVLALLVFTLAILLLVYGEIVIVNDGQPFSVPLLIRTLLEEAGAIVYFVGYILYRVSNVSDSSDITEDE